MLYETKRNFGNGNIELKNAVFAMVGETLLSQAVYAGPLGVSATPATAGSVDYEAKNQQFPNLNTLEVFCLETADSTTDTATAAVTLQSSADAGTTWVSHYTSTFTQAMLVKSMDIPVLRMSMPGDCGALVRLKVVVGAEAFTAGQLFAVARPL